MSTITDPEVTENPSKDDRERELSTISLSTPIRFVGFWTAVALPFLYLPLLATGLETTGQRQTFVFLFALNVVALVVGRRYRET
ncbi:hypothetical protein [Haladaptatus sp. NG-WS-4]